MKSGAFVKQDRLGRLNRIAQLLYLNGVTEIINLQPDARVTEMLPLRYRLLAAEVLQLGQVTQGQFARFVRLDIIAARELYESLSERLTVSDEGDVGAIDLDLGSPITQRG